MNDAEEKIKKNDDEIEKIRKDALIPYIIKPCTLFLATTCESVHPFEFTINFLEIAQYIQFSYNLYRWVCLSEFYPLVYNKCQLD